MADFMQPQVVYDTWLVIETNEGTVIYPSIAHDIGEREYPDAEKEYKEGWCCRLSAPGYMDCTDWSGPFKTEKEARDYLIELYDLEMEGDGESE